MPVSEKQLDAWGRFSDAHFDKVGREGSYEPPPSDISSNTPCIRSGLLTPPRRHRVRRPRPARDPRPPDNSVAEFVAWLKTVPKPPPEFLPSLDQSSVQYINLTPGMEHDLGGRTLRSKSRKQPYLFALNTYGEMAIASAGDDTSPSEKHGRCGRYIHCNAIVVMLTASGLKRFLRLRVMILS